MGEANFGQPGAGMMKRGRGGLIAYGIISIAIGMIAFVWPFPATMAVTIFVGAMLIATGIAALASGLTGQGHESRWYDILFGLLTLIIGCLLAFRPISGAISLTLLIAIWLGLRGFLEIVWGVLYPRHRWWMISMGAVNIALVVLIVLTIPITSMLLPGYLLSLSFLMGGITAIAIARRMPRGA